jgi:hypothetical protein
MIAKAKELAIAQDVEWLERDVTESGLGSETIDVLRDSQG